jgi:hypothetical protein
MLFDGNIGFSNISSPAGDNCGDLNALNALNALNNSKALGKCIRFYKRSEVLSALSAVERKGRVKRKIGQFTRRESHRTVK